MALFWLAMVKYGVLRCIRVRDILCIVLSGDVSVYYGDLRVKYGVADCILTRCGDLWRSTVHHGSV